MIHILGVCLTKMMDESFLFFFCNLVIPPETHELDSADDRWHQQKERDETDKVGGV